MKQRKRDVLIERERKGKAKDTGERICLVARLHTHGAETYKDNSIVRVASSGGRVKLISSGSLEQSIPTMCSLLKSQYIVWKRLLGTVIQS